MEWVRLMDGAPVGRCRLPLAITGARGDMAMAAILTTVADTRMATLPIIMAEVAITTSHQEEIMASVRHVTLRQLHLRNVRFPVPAH